MSKKSWFHSQVVLFHQLSARAHVIGRHGYSCSHFAKAMLGFSHLGENLRAGKSLPAFIEKHFPYLATDDFVWGLICQPRRSRSWRKGQHERLPV